MFCSLLFASWLCFTPAPIVCEPLPVKTIIERTATQYNVDVKTALRIAECESETGKNLFNKHSSAKGVYQFIDGTWKNYCEGDVLNSRDNIICFMKLYPKHPSWWRCK